jgi:hypothetical protein
MRRNLPRAVDLYSVLRVGQHLPDDADDAFID